MTLTCAFMDRDSPSSSAERCPSGVRTFPERSVVGAEEGSIGTFRFHLAMSLDGYVAGPDQSEENPLGVGGMQLHQWLVPLEAFRRSHGGEGGEVNAST